MDFQEHNDWISLAIAKLSAAFPRFKVPPGTVMLLRERFAKYTPDVVDRAILTLQDSCEGSFPSMAQINRSLRGESQHADVGQVSHLDPSPEAYEALSIQERRALAHAKDVLQRVDFRRRDVTVPSVYHELRALDVEREMEAHGIQISLDRSRVRYDPRRLLRPVDCPMAESLRIPQSRDWKAIADEAGARFRERMENVIFDNQERIALAEAERNAP